MVTVYVVEAVAPTVSVAVTVKVEVPEAIGVPVSVPALALRVRPSGMLPVKV